jgi:hypothetical protein
MRMVVVHYKPLTRFFDAWQEPVLTFLRLVDSRRAVEESSIRVGGSIPETYRSILPS